ncbi:hypothetical protein CTAYLR_001553 [Chrysophaeum taylorii]|uniref:CCAAT-binding factor domain-containing protein n=1 Tax=Chrysophaeum taylorii TaxID=2483200 RepID=A0AAD7UE83_9STRA|nr:hypothetical protein CTAYLR_001553 [Chrysophaeum taylorii]
MAKRSHEEGAYESFAKAWRGAEAVDCDEEIVRRMHAMRKAVARAGRMRGSRAAMLQRAHSAFAAQVGAWVRAGCGAVAQVVGLRSVFKLLGVEGLDHCGAVGAVVRGACESERLAPEALVVLEGAAKESAQVRMWALRACKRAAKGASACDVLLRIPSDEASERGLEADVWVEVLSGPIDRREHALSRLPALMSAMRNPLRFADLFVAAFDESPVVALPGIFELVAYHRLDYPRFFDKLVSLVDRDLLYSEHLDVVLGVARRALANAPPSVRLGVAERLSAAAVAAPPRAIAAALRLLADLMGRCPVCHAALTTPDRPPHEHLRALATHYAPNVRHAVIALVERGDPPPDDLDQFTYEALYAAQPDIPDASNVSPVPFQHDDDFRYTDHPLLPTPVKDESPSSTSLGDPLRVLAAKFSTAATAAGYCTTLASS